MSFESELRDLINRHSMENASNTPDFILADYLVRCLDAFDTVVAMRDDWHKLPPRKIIREERETGR